MIITVGNIKGGVSKSSISQSLTVGLMNRGLSVYLVDADPQETTAEWIEERRANEALSIIRFGRHTGKIRDELLALEETFDVVIVDVGGHDSDSLRWALSVSTHALIPFRPKRRDLKALVKLDAMLSVIKPINPDCKFVAVITQAPTLPNQMPRINNARDVINSFDIDTLKTILYNRNVYDDADEEGSTIYEIATDPKAIAEFDSLIEELLEI